VKRSLLAILALTILSVTAFAVPNQLTYSGRLLQNGALVNSTLPMDFKIYTDPTAGALLWQQTLPSVEVNQGIYSVVLGDTSNPISPNTFVTDNAYLQVVVNGETLSPRTKINSVGYALQAGGLSMGGVSAVTVSTNGAIGIGTSNPLTALHINKDQGAGTKVRVQNSNTGAGAFAQLEAATDLNALIGYSLGSGYATSGRYIANAGLLEANGAGGLGFSASNVNGRLLFWTAGSNERMRISSGGNVGIGVTAPETKLSIAGPTNGSSMAFEPYTYFGSAYSIAALVLGNMVKPNIGTLGYSKSAGITIPQSLLEMNGGFTFATKASDSDPADTPWSLASNAKMVITNAGNIGVGTTNPLLGKLQVKGTITQMDDQNSFLYLGRYSGIDSNAYIVGGDSDRDYAVNLAFRPRLDTGVMFDAMTIYGSSGRVNTPYGLTAGIIGIGTVAPLAKLDIQSNIDGYPGTQGRGNATAFIYGHPSGGNFSPFIRVANYNRGVDLGIDNSSRPYIASVGGTEFYISVNAAERLYIKSDGSVGINTTNPGAMLDVNGPAKINGNLINGVVVAGTYANTYDWNFGGAGVTDASSKMYEVFGIMWGDAPVAANYVWIITVYNTGGINVTTVHSTVRGGDQSVSITRPSANIIRFTTNNNGTIKSLKYRELY
jgi:hypothetical protein